MLTLKLETGSYFLLTLVKGLQNSCDQCFSPSSHGHFYINVNLVCRLYIRNKLNTTKFTHSYHAIFSSDNKNLFNDLKSLNLC